MRGRIFLLTYATLILTACAPKTPTPRAPVTVLVLMRFPAGTRMAMVDNRAAGPAIALVQKVAGMQDAESVARDGELELRVRIQSDEPVNAVRGALTPGALGEIASVEFATLEGLPAPASASLVPRLHVTIDPARAAALGVASADVDAVLAHLGKETTPEQARGSPVKVINGGVVRLEDVATFEMKADSDCIVRRWP